MVFATGLAVAILAAGLTGTASADEEGDYIEWEDIPEEAPDEEPFNVTVTGHSSEDGEVCVADTSLFGYEKCQDISAGDFEVTFTTHALQDLDSDEADFEAGIPLETLLQLEGLPGELVVQIDSADEIEMRGSLYSDDWFEWGSVAETSTNTIDINTTDNIEWEHLPDEVESDEHFDARLVGESSTSTDVCLDEEGLFSYNSCEAIGPGEFNVTFTIHPEQDLGAEPGDEIKLHGKLDDSLLGSEAETKSGFVSIEGDGDESESGGGGPGFTLPVVGAALGGAALTKRRRNDGANANE